MSDKLSLEELKASYKGRGGGPESESIVVDSNLDKRENYVSVYSSNKELLVTHITLTDPFLCPLLTLVA